MQKVAKGATTLSVSQVRNQKYPGTYGEGNGK